MQPKYNLTRQQHLQWENCRVPAKSSHVKFGGQAQSHHTILLNEVHCHFTIGTACHNHLGPTAAQAYRLQSKHAFVEVMCKCDLLCCNDPWFDMLV